MSNALWRAALAVLIGVPLADAGAQATVKPDEARAAIRRAVPIMQASADTWFEKRSCSSCHHQGLGTIAMSMLYERGMNVDTARLHGQARRTMRPTANWQERYAIHEVSINQPIGQTYRLLGALAAGHPRTPLATAVAHMIAGEQHRDGVWRSYSHRPPMEDDEMTATALAVRTLSLISVPGRDREFRDRIDRARKWLATATPASTEARTMQIIGLAWAGADSRQLQPYARALLAEQQSDGGWSQTRTRESDAYATGQALTVLQQAARVSQRDPRVQRGLRWLLDTQDSAGTWRVRTMRTGQSGLPYFESGFPHGADQFISYAGTAWAVMALSSVIDGKPSIALLGTPQVRFAADADTLRDGLTPLHRGAMYGTIDDLRSLLARHDSVNVASPIGVTPLMAAVHDSAKAHLLLDAGADPNAATRAGHTPLQLATAYQGARGSARLLLARGARQERPVTTSSASRGAAFTYALLRGDTVLAQELLALGADINGVNKERESPLMTAVWYADGGMLRWLLDRGALVDDRPPAGTPQNETPLMVAAQEGNIEAVRLLLARGADVHRADGEGYTALHFAAETHDRGSPEIIELLLNAGSDPSRRIVKGMTPEELARTFRKPWAADLLRAKSGSGK